MLYDCFFRFHNRHQILGNLLVFFAAAILTKISCIDPRFAPGFVKTLTVWGIAAFFIDAFIIAKAFRGAGKTELIFMELCFLVQNAVFLFYLLKSDFFDGLSPSPFFDAVLGYTAGWLPFLMFSIALSSLVMSEKIDPFAAEAMHLQASHSMLSIMMLSEFANFISIQTLSSLGVMIFSCLFILMAYGINLLISTLCSIPIRFISCMK